MHDVVLDAWAIMAWLKGRQPASRDPELRAMAKQEKRLKLEWIGA